MKRNYLKPVAVAAAVVCGLYLFLPLAVFDFTHVAVPRDEENFGAKPVGIGPRPRPWAARFLAADVDLPGGYGYDAEGWAFRLWKPLGLWLLKRNGYVPPAEWR